MVERSDQIEKHIASTRSELGSNLQDLEDKVKQAAESRTYFDRNPMMLMGLALGGGVLLGAMTAAAPQYRNMSRPGAQNGLAADTWGTLKGALIGLAGSKVRTLLEEVVPGFNQQYKKMERDISASVPSHSLAREFDSAHRM